MGHIFVSIWLIFQAIPSLAGEFQMGEASMEVNGIKLSVFTFHPNNCSARGLVFTFHGQKRNADKYRDHAQQFAERFCLIVYAPKFDLDRFKSWRYQRGGIVHKGKVQPQSKWTTSLIQPLIDWARRREGMAHKPYFLYGHSAGGQFLSRIAAYTPIKDAQRFVIANPSSHVWPSLNEDAPYGMGGLYSKDNANDQLRNYLKQPITIFLGLDDTGSQSLSGKKAAMRQGEHRFARGKNAFAVGEAMGHQNAWPFNWTIIKVPGAGHSSREMLNSPQARTAFGIEPQNK